MKKTTALAMAVLFLGAMGLVEVGSQTETATARRAEPAATQQVTAERRRRGKVCSLSDIPIFVSPNRGSATSRIGGGSRGGNLEF